MKYPTCKFSLKSVQEVSSQIADKVKSSASFSLVRLGDGEGLLLSISDQSTEADFRCLAGHLGPKTSSLDYLSNLKSRLIESIKGADIIGVRDDIVDVTFEPSNFSARPDEFLKSFQRNFRVRQVEKEIDYHGARRIALLHQNLSQINLPDNNQFCSAWFHYEYHIVGEVFKLLRQQERVGVISCRTRLPGLLEGLFDISVQFNEIPDMFRDVSLEQSDIDYVGQLESILDRQLVEFPGMLYLVGGGVFGKLYCQLIKSQGGIAIDLGSLFDAWLGISTRPLVYRSMFGMHSADTRVPSGLLLGTETVDDLLLAKPDDCFENKAPSASKRLVMTLLVRDEQDIIRENIEFHLAQGVDFFIATDNRSVDATTFILKEYEARGLLHYIYEGSDDYNQHAWVTRMARLAYTEYGADWVINNDADEFWWPLQGTLKEVFDNLPRTVNVVKADRHNFVVVEGSGEPFWSRMLYREKVSLNALGRPLPPKVAHLGSAMVKVSQGNHAVGGMGPLREVDGLIEILHFPVRSHQQIENKIALGGAAYGRNRELPESTGRTWRKLYEDYQAQGGLGLYFDDQVHNSCRLGERTNMGEIFQDTKLQDYFEKNL